jgi:hypothetical protein
MRMKIMNVLRAAMRHVEAFLAVRLPMDALVGLRTLERR